MNIKFNLLVVFSILLSYEIKAQSWPIHQADDPDHFYIISAEFGEIHPFDPYHIPPNYPDHFHRAIDINIDGNVEVYPIGKGKVYGKG